MLDTRSVFRLLSCAVLFACGGAASQSAGLKFVFRPFTFPGASLITLLGLNDSGVLIGTYYDANSKHHAFVDQNGVVTIIDHPNAFDTEPRAINAQGIIVGAYAKTSSGFNHAYIDRSGVFTDIAPGQLSSATGINDRGDVVGIYQECEFCPQHGFLFDGITYRTIDAPNAAETAISGINNNRIMAVTGLTPRFNGTAYVYDGKAFTQIDVPGAKVTYAEGIDGRGDVLLSWQAKGSRDTLGAVYHDGKFSTFSDPNGFTTYAFGINDKRTIVGSWLGRGLKSGAYIATY